jgi:predicted nucleic acid-binding protein
VLDISVAAAWCFVDEDDRYAGAVLHRLRSQNAVVPGVFEYELANVMLVGTRQGRISEERAYEFMSMITELPIARAEIATPADALFDTGRAYGLSSYDAAYLLVAMRARLPLATNDVALRKAARKARVALVTP